MPMIPILIGAGLGLAQGIEGYAQEKSRQPTVATTEEFAPFTGANINQAQASLHPAQIFSSTAGGGLAGAAAAQSIYGQNENINLKVAQNPADKMPGLDQNSFWKTNPYSAGAAGAPSTPLSAPASPAGGPSLGVGQTPAGLTMYSPYSSGQNPRLLPLAAGAQGSPYFNPYFNAGGSS